jgi:hypothetical protein
LLLYCKASLSAAAKKPDMPKPVGFGLEQAKAGSEKKYRALDKEIEILP